MSTGELLLIGGAFALGWVIVSRLFDWYSSQRGPKQAPPGAVSTDAYTVLGVAADAEDSELHARYHEAIAECDRVRFDPSSAAGTAAEALSRRRELDSAYDAVRTERAARRRRA